MKFETIEEVMVVLEAGCFGKPYIISYTVDDENNDIYISLLFKSLPNNIITKITSSVNGFVYSSENLTTGDMKQINWWNTPQAIPGYEFRVASHVLTTETFIKLKEKYFK